MSSRKMPFYGYPHAPKSSVLKNTFLVGTVFVVSALSGVGIAVLLSPEKEQPTQTVSVEAPAIAPAPVVVAADKVQRPQVEITAAVPKSSATDGTAAELAAPAPQRLVELATIAPALLPVLSDAPEVPMPASEAAVMPDQPIAASEPLAPAIAVPLETAAVLPNADPTPVVGPVQIAETEADVVALEQQLTENGNAYFQVPLKEEPPFEAVAPTSNITLQKAWTNAWVNMRAAPDNNGRTVAILASGKEIRAEANCVHWCKVSADGKQGYIYKSFIRH